MSEKISLDSSEREPLLSMRIGMDIRIVPSISCQMMESGHFELSRKKTPLMS